MTSSESEPVSSPLLKVSLSCQLLFIFPSAPITGNKCAHRSGLLLCLRCQFQHLRRGSNYFGPCRVAVRENNPSLPQGGESRSDSRISWPGLKDRRPDCVEKPRHCRPAASILGALVRTNSCCKCLLSSSWSDSIGTEPPAGGKALMVPVLLSGNEGIVWFSF